ncbi:MAG: hypothetical protein WBR26_01095 [Candidatus Acidiferrum sp.]
MERYPEKRQNARIPVGFSLQFQCVSDEDESSDYAAETENVSAYGLLMISAKKLDVGSMVLLKLRIPVEVSGSAFSCVHSTGRVVRQELRKDGATRYGVAITGTGVCARPKPAA